MITRVALYHRWRRWKRISLGYPVILCGLSIGAVVAIWWLATYSG